MSDQSKKQQSTKQSAPSGGKTGKTSKRSQIGDSKESRDHLRKAMEIPPKKGTEGKKEK
jgi:hypothetical protein